jgi:hypothetical protein
VSLREQAAADARAILEDASGFGWLVQVTSPAGVTAALSGFTTDVREAFDPETGQMVNGRRASVAVHVRSLEAVGLAIPRGVADSSVKPWIVRFADVQGVERTFKVVESRPDLAAGVVVLILEIYAV